MIIQYQKYIIITILFSINIILSTTFIIYSNKWYAYIFILACASIIYSFSSILLLGKKMINNDPIQYRTIPRNYLYIVPCYNESETELKDTINSLVSQRFITGDKRMMIIICDGKVKGKGNGSSTDIILKKLLKNNEFPEYFQYTTWDNMDNLVFLYKGYYTVNLDTIPYILIIKNKNYGKRDSLVLARKLCYYYNKTFTNEIPSQNLDDITNQIISYFNLIYSTKIDYIIGIDADTVFDHNCTYELIQGIEKDDMIQGCVGYVDISPTMNMYSPFVLYQYAEYMFAQCLKRQAQSNITNKVTCLSGCNQILRVSKETCGDDILKQFNYLPKEEENIFNHIRSYASEDRNHVCHMLSMYPYVKTTQALKANAYTKVPTSVKVFISQRRRWSLGANCNDMMLVYLPGINIFERISAFVNVFLSCLIPFIFIATVIFIKTIITEPSLLMLYIGILMIIPLTYGMLIPIFIKQLSFRNSMYYYLSFLFFITIGSIVNLCIYFYSLICMDVIKWGKTRSVDVKILHNDVDTAIDVDVDINSMIVEEAQVANNNDILKKNNRNRYLDKIVYKYNSTDMDAYYQDEYNTLF